MNVEVRQVDPGAAVDDELQVKDESVEDTLVDIINYTVLLRAYLKEQGEHPALESVPD